MNVFYLKFVWSFIQKVNQVLLKEWGGGFSNDVFKLVFFLQENVRNYFFLKMKI